jgi:hypothetical protein
MSAKRENGLGVTCKRLRAVGAFAGGDARGPGKSRASFVATLPSGFRPFPLSP